MFAFPGKNLKVTVTEKKERDTDSKMETAVEDNSEKEEETEITDDATPTDRQESVSQDDQAKITGTKPKHS